MCIIFAIDVYLMVFEYDPVKSEINKTKHGIDFEDAKFFWNDLTRIEIDARTQGEFRKLLIASWNNTIWSAVFTIRNGAIRIISVRKSRKNEREIYYSTGV